MAGTLYVAEFSTMPFTSNAVGDKWAMSPSIADQAIAINATLSTQSSTFNIATSFVRLSSTHVCSVAFGLSPVASTSNMRIAANDIEYFGVVPGSKIAVIQNN